MLGSETEQGQACLGLLEDFPHLAFWQVTGAELSEHVIPTVIRCFPAIPSLTLASPVHFIRVHQLFTKLFTSIV